MKGGSGGGGGLNTEGYANPPIRAFFHQIRCSANIFVQIPNHSHIREQKRTEAQRETGKGECHC